MWTALVTILYPIAVWLFWGKVNPIVFAIPVMGIVLSRIYHTKLVSHQLRLPVLAMASLLILTAFMLAPQISTLIYPFIISLVLLIFFGLSLRSTKTPVIEKLARAHDPDFPDHAVSYTRRVTWVWVIYFLGNAVLNLLWIISDNIEAWVLHNTVIAYVVMGILFAGEWLVRQRVKARQS